MAKKLFEIKKGNLFFNKFHALKDINLTINQGDRIALIGVNGAGKSTLVDVLTRVKKLKSGTLYRDEKALKRNVGIQFQSHDFPSGLTFKDLLHFYLGIHGKSLNDLDVQANLTSFQAQKLLARPLRKISGGQQQIVNIILALINNPKVLIIDEVLTSLDVVWKRHVLNLVAQFLKDKPHLTILTVSHNAQELELIAQRLIEIHNGKIIKDASKSQIKREYGSLTNYLNQIGEKNYA